MNRVFAILVIAAFALTGMVIAGGNPDDYGSGTSGINNSARKPDRTPAQTDTVRTGEGLDERSSDTADLIDTADITGEDDVTGTTGTGTSGATGTTTRRTGDTLGLRDTAGMLEGGRQRQDTLGRPGTDTYQPDDDPDTDQTLDEFDPAGTDTLDTDTVGSTGGRPGGSTTTGTTPSYGTGTTSQTYGTGNTGRTGTDTTHTHLYDSTRAATRTGTAGTVTGTTGTTRLSDTSRTITDTLTIEGNTGGTRGTTGTTDGAVSGGPGGTTRTTDGVIDTGATRARDRGADTDTTDRVGLDESGTGSTTGVGAGTQQRPDTGYFDQSVDTTDMQTGRDTMSADSVYEGDEPVRGSATDFTDTTRGFDQTQGGRTDADTDRDETNRSYRGTETDWTSGQSGLMWRDIQVGSGDRATSGSQVKVRYTGWLHEDMAKGRKFDSSIDRNKDFTFTLGAGQVIRGWDEGLIGMQEGGIRELLVPAELGYGEAGAGGGVIPPNSTLIFEVELVEVLDQGQE